MKLSLCMIVKDEEAVLARCLKSVEKLFDELIVVDTGSTDGTKEIAKRFGAKIYDFIWEDNFASARNFSFSKATGDYVAWLDADDVLPPEERAQFFALRALLKEKRPDLVFCPYDVGIPQNGHTVSTFYRERFFLREANFQWQGRVHECVAPRGKQVKFDLRVRHLGSKKERGTRNLHLYQAWQKEEKLSPRDKFYYGRELYYHKLYVEACAVLGEMLNENGWYVNQIEACRVLSKCYLARGKREEAFYALTRSFLYGEPRASVLCDMGELLSNMGKSREAIFWFSAAMNCKDHAQEGDFDEPLSRDLIPLLAIVCCYCALGEHEKAFGYHKQSKKKFPAHPSVLHNEEYFKRIGFIE